MIDRKEIKWVLFFSLTAIILTTLPYALGYIRHNPDWHFSGLIFNLDDSNSYLAKMLRGASGDWLFRTPYTTIPQSGVISFFPYLLLGKLTSPPGQYDQIIFLFHLYRWVGIGFVIYSIYQFISHFVSQIYLRRWGTVLAVFGGGAGWLFLFGFGFLWGRELPLEFISPETFGFLSLLGLPHLLFSRALLILGYSTLLFSEPPGRDFKRLSILVLPWILIGLFQPMSLITAWAVIASFITILYLVDKFSSSKNNPEIHNYFSKTLWIIIFTLPIVLYNVVAFRFDPVLRSWLAQNILKSPPMVNYVLAFIFILPFAFIGLYRIYRTNRISAAFFGAWLFIFPLLAYFPLSIQRRLPEGIWIALVALAIISISKMSGKSGKISLGVIALGCITTIMILAGSIQSVAQLAAPRYISSREKDALQFLQSPRFKNQKILASFSTSNKLPAWAPVFVLTGHGPESVNQADILPRITHFFQSSLSLQEQIVFLEEFGINLIFFGPDEKKLGSWRPENQYFDEVYTNGEVSIYSYQK